MLRTLLLLPALTLTGVATRVEAPPVAPVRVVAAFRLPVSAFAPGHRGVDLAASPGQTVVSPITGVVTFADAVGGRSVVSVSDGFRLVSLEPVTSRLPAGSTVRAGAPLGTVGVGGHCSLRCVHLGMRVDGEYVAPLGLRPRLVP